MKNLFDKNEVNTGRQAEFGYMRGWNKFYDSVIKKDKKVKKERSAK